MNVHGRPRQTVSHRSAIRVPPIHHTLRTSSRVSQSIFCDSNSIYTIYTHSYDNWALEYEVMTSRIAVTECTTSFGNSNNIARLRLIVASIFLMSGRYKTK